MVRPRVRLRRWIAAVTAVVAVSAGGAFVASPAHAEQFAGVDEGFDGVPDDRWDFDVVEGQASVRMGRNTLARSNLTAAQLDASSYANSGATITRTFNPDPNTTFGQCAVNLYLRRLVAPSEPFPTVQVVMRVRRGGPTGEISSVRGVTVGTTVTWERWAFSNNFSYPTGQLTLEIMAFRGIVLVDDLRITCGTR